MEKLISMYCAKCCITFGLTEEMFRRRKQDGKEFYCSNGHSNIFNAKEVKFEEELTFKDKTIKELHEEILKKDDEIMRVSALLEKSEASQ